MDKEQTTIFIVDDVQDNAIVLVTIFEPLGYKTMVAMDGKTALSMIEEYKPDIILLDIMMPDMDGYQVCSKLKSNPVTREIPVIFLSALTDTTNKVKGLEIGGVDYISKPFEEAEVISRVKVHLENSFLQRELKSLNDKKNRFFTIIAKDLKKPLATIMNATKLLEDFVLAKDMKSIQTATNSLSEVTNNAMAFLRNLLEWSRVQTENLHINITKLNMGGILHKSLQPYQKEITNKNLKVINNISREATVYGDRYMINMVFENLISNAIKFSMYDGIIELKESDEGDFLKIQIGDTGIGMNQEERENLFMIDKAIRSKGTAGETGTGLGLILSKEFIEKNGGSISVEKNDPRGTLVTVTLPKKDLSSVLQ